MEEAIVHSDIGSIVNMRESDSTSSSVVERISVNETVFILEKGKDWSKIKYKKKVGYMMNQFLVFDSSSDT